MRADSKQLMKPTIQLDVLTLFPSFFDSPLKQSILGRSIAKNITKVNIHNLRNYAFDRRKTVDDKSYGGGAGMVLRVDVLVNALEKLTAEGVQSPYIILLDPKGRVFNQELAEKLSKKKRILLVCGHYEGVDERFAENWADEILSIGDYILSGGEPAAIVLIDSIARLQKGVLGNIKSKESESFSRKKMSGQGTTRTLDYPVYTRPEVFKGKRVPKVLVEGDHEKINSWRKKKALEATERRRPDLLTSP